MSDEYTENTESVIPYEGNNDSGTSPDGTSTGDTPPNSETPPDGSTPGEGNNDSEPDPGNSGTTGENLPDGNIPDEGDNDSETPGGNPSDGNGTNTDGGTLDENGTNTDGGTDTDGSIPEEPEVTLIGNKTGDNDGTKVIPSLKEVNDALTQNFSTLANIQDKLDTELQAHIGTTTAGIAGVNEYIDNLVGEGEKGPLSSTAWTDSVNYSQISVGGETSQSLKDGKLVIFKNSDLTRAEDTPNVDITTGMGNKPLTSYQLIENEYLRKTINATIECIRKEYDALIQRVHEESMAVMAVSRYVMCNPSRDNGTLSWDVPSAGWIVGIRTNRNGDVSYKTFDGKTFDAETFNGDNTDTSKVALSQESEAPKLIGYDRADRATESHEILYEISLTEREFNDLKNSIGVATN